MWKTAPNEGQRHLKWMGVIAFLTGLGSAFYHATGTQVGMLADYAGMFLDTSLVTAFNVRRWLHCSLSTMYSVFVVMTLTLLLVIWMSPGNERIVFTLGSPCCLIELYLYFRDGKYIRYRYYLAVWVVFAVATLVWWLDVNGYACDPKNHILTGHAIWHILVASTFYFYYRYYVQFEWLKPLPNNTKKRSLESSQ